VDGVVVTGAVGVVVVPLFEPVPVVLPLVEPEPLCGQGCLLVPLPLVPLPPLLVVPLPLVEVVEPEPLPLLPPFGHGVFVSLLPDVLPVYDEPDFDVGAPEYETPWRESFESPLEAGDPPDCGEPELPCGEPLDEAEPFGHGCFEPLWLSFELGELALWGLPPPEPEPWLLSLWVDGDWPYDVFDDVEGEPCEPALPWLEPHDDELPPCPFPLPP